MPPLHCKHTQSQDTQSQHAQSHHTQWGLGLLGAGLIALHLVLTWTLVRQTDQLMLSILIWGAIASLVWQRRNTLKLHSGWLSSFLGLFVLTVTLCKSWSLLWFESSFVRLFPGFAALSWMLLASGFQPQHYGKELTLIATLMMPQGLLANIIHTQTGALIPTLIAQAAAFLLHYGGLSIQRQGVEIILGQTVVEVEYACTGIPMLIILLQLAVVLMLLFPVTTAKKLWLGIMVVAIAFSLSSIRVVVMVLAVNHPASFDYWHGVPGSQLFSTAAIGLFIVGYRLFIEES